MWSSLLVGVPFGVFPAKKCTRGGFHAVYFALQPAKFALTRKDARLLGCFATAAAAGARWDTEERLVNGERALLNYPRAGEHSIVAFFNELVAQEQLPLPPVETAMQHAELTVLHQALAHDAQTMRRSDSETGPGMQLLHAWFAATIATVSSRVWQCYCVSHI